MPTLQCSTSQMQDSSQTVREAMRLHESPELGKDQVHVWLVLPPVDLKRAREKESALQPPSKLTSLLKLLRSSRNYGNLPKDGEFLKLMDWTDDDCGQVKNIEAVRNMMALTSARYYVRRENLCVLEHFKSFMQDEIDTGDENGKQFILTGSPGMGKSCILALICCWLAVHKRRRVAWHGGGVTRLFYQGGYFVWTDVDGKLFESLRWPVGSNLRMCWFCLDGLSQNEINRRSWANRYMLLAASGDFYRASDEVAFKQRSCLVPYWKQNDFEDLAKQLGKPKKNEIASRYYASGGNLCDFLLVNSRLNLQLALGKLTTRDVELLLTPFGSSSLEQLVPNARHYAVKTGPLRSCSASCS